jgi:hypothetical protein
MAPPPWDAPDCPPPPPGDCADAMATLAKSAAVLIKSLLLIEGPLCVCPRAQVNDRAVLRFRDLTKNGIDVMKIDLQIDYRNAQVDVQINIHSSIR